MATYMGLVRTVKAEEVVTGDVLHYKKRSNLLVTAAQHVDDEFHITVHLVGLKPIVLDYVPEQFVHVLRPYIAVGV